jgi:hypothetical protein
MLVLMGFSASYFVVIMLMDIGVIRYTVSADLACALWNLGGYLLFFLLQ